MASTLERMFLFAKATGAEQRENFTTEALAGAIRSDPLPFFAALRARGIAAEAESVLVETQLWLTGTGRLDLVVEHGPRDARRSMWIEVKVDAQVDRDQLARYHERATRGGATQTRVLLLARDTPPGLPAGVGAISWQAVWAAIRGVAVSPCWADFKLYMEEIKMADTFLEPVTREESAALGSAASLLGKVTRILAPFAAEARKLWPASNWNTAEGKLAEEIFKTLVAFGTASINSLTGDVAGAAAGARHREDGGDAWLGLWVWVDPRRALQGAERVCRQADAGGLDVAWERHGAGWEPLLVYHRLDDFRHPGEATEWLLARLRELERAGVLRLLSELG